MPTGYTAGVQDGTITNFGDFVMRCARAMGVCVTMRDLPSDALIPEKFELDTAYHDNAIISAKHRLAELNALDAAGVTRLAASRHQENMIEFQESATKRETQRIRYKTMLEKVTAWDPPSSDHEGLRSFMADQLRESIEHDCRAESPPEALTGPEIVKQLRESYALDIEHHEKSIREETQRIGGRNKWLAQLRESLLENEQREAVIKNASGEGAA